MKKTSHTIGTQIQSRILWGLCLLGAAALILLGVLISNWFHEKENPDITSQSIAEQLTKISELSTMQMQYRDISHYEDGEITFLTKKSFNVIYDATVKAGMDLSQAEVAVKNHQITISLPPAEILSIYIDPSSLEFYDERYALFNWQDREDTVLILENAEQDIRQKVLQSELLNQAESQAKEMISQFFASLVQEEEYSVQVNIQAA
ncbi:MAG: DUF4230 domain-containing protein [Massiliimalia sp.]